MLNKPVLVVTNPLHYVYYPHHSDLTCITSTQGIMRDYAEQLNFGDVEYHDAANTPAALIMADAVPGRSYITWKPVDTTKKVLGNSYKAAARLEQKTVIRQILPAHLFPEFLQVSAEAVATTTYKALATKLASNDLVIQIDNSTGGKGTFFISSEADFNQLLPTVLASQQAIVVSRRVTGTPRAVQCLIVDGQLYMMPWWHRDLVGLQGVCDINAPSATRYCGAVLENIPQQFKASVQALATQVAEVLHDQNYYGIFGIDLVTNETTGELHLIEVNPRFTAVSHLYASAMRAVGYSSDFLSAHVQGLVEPTPKALQEFRIGKQLPDMFYYLKLQNTTGKTVKLTSVCQMGVYSSSNLWIRPGWGIDALQDASECVVIPETAQNIERSPGQRVFSIIGSGDPLTLGALNPAIERRIATLMEQALVRF